MREPASVTELQRERGLFVGKPEFGCGGPQRRDLRGRHARLDHVDGNVEQLAAPFIGIDQRRRRAADRERAVVARPVPVVAVDDVEVGGIARPQRPIRIDVRVRVGPLSGDRVDALDEL